MSWFRLLTCVQQDVERLAALQKIHCRWKNTKTSFVKKSKSSKKTPLVSEVSYIADKPTTVIYNMKDFPPQPFTLCQCIDMHQEAASPQMTNTTQAQIYADCTVDFSTRKKTKFIKDVRGLLEFPHPFTHGQKKIFYLFSEDKTDVELAKERGAVYAGGEDIINYMNQNLIRKEDVLECDFIFATPAMATKLLNFRVIVGDRMPTIHNGCVTNDMKELLEKYDKGVRYRSRKDNQAVGKMQIPFGQLCQTADQIQENFQYMIETLSSIKPKYTEPLISSISLIAPPSEECFLLNKESFTVEKEDGGKKQEDEDSDDED